MKVDVVYANVRAQDLVALELPEGATVADAIRRSGLVAAWAQDGDDLVPAIRGRAVAPETPLVEGDRLELLRPVAVDPRVARRRRAATKARRNAKQ